MRTAVVLDSGSYYYVEKINVEGIFAVPLQIIEGDKTYRETVDITIQEVNERLKKHITLKTSLPALGHIEDLFTEIKELGYDQILAIPITSGISGTIGAMESAAQFIGIDFYSIDPFTTAWIAQEIGKIARIKLDEGMDVKDVIELFNVTLDNSDTFIIPDDLSHLSRGGRLSPVAAALGGLLKIKPILHLNKSTNGVIDAFNKVRTMTRAIDLVIDHMKQVGVGAGYFIGIADVDAKELASIVSNKIREAFPEARVVENDLISTVSCHVGIGSIAFQYAKFPE